MGQRLRSSTISRRRWRPSATPSSPSFMVQQEELQVACLTWEAWEELLGEPHLGLEVREELDPPLRRSTKSLLGTIVFSLSFFHHPQREASLCACARAYA